MMFNGFTFLVVGVSLALVLRQRGSYFKSIKLFIVSAYALFSSTLVLEYLRDILESDVIGFWYTSAGTSAIILANLALTVSAVIISGSPSFVLNYLGFKTKRKLNIPLLLYVTYAVFLIVATWSMSPFTLTFIPRPYGDKAISPIFEDWYSLGLVILQLAFIAYPCRLMILRSRRTHSPIASKALALIPIHWAGVGGIMIAFNGYFRYLGLEIVDLGNLISAGLFLITAYFFRKTTLLESFFEETMVAEIPKADYAGIFSERLGLTHSRLIGKKVLLELDPSSSYERIVKDFIQENILGNKPALVVTRRSSPVYIALADQRRVRFLCLTPTVSYPKEGSSDREMLIPQDDLSITLGAINNALKATSDAGLTVVFDSLSDLMVSLGVEKTYAFLGYSLELLSKPNVTVLYLMNPSAHDPKAVSTIRALFAIQIAHKEGRLRIVKAPVS